MGLLFFNERPDEFFPQTQIDVVLLPEGAGGDVIRERTFTGPLDQQLRDALAFLRNSVIEEVVRKHPDRAEADRFFNYPYVAIEEALVNAVYHRSYEEREPIEVRVLPDQITIASFPGPDRSISLAELQTGSFVTRRYRNRRIGEFLKELKLTEGRGTGVPKILRAMRLNGSPPPEFRTDEDRTYFATILPVHPEVGGVHEGPTPHLTTEVTTEVGTLTEVERALLEFCREPRRRAEIQSHLGMRNERHLRGRYLQPLLERGLLELTQPESPRSPTQQYRTTALGLLVLGESPPS